MYVALPGAGLKRPEQMMGFILFAFISPCQAALENVPSHQQIAARRRPGHSSWTVGSSNGPLARQLRSILITPISRLDQ